MRNMAKERRYHPYRGGNLKSSKVEDFVTYFR